MHLDRPTTPNRRTPRIPASLHPLAAMAGLLERLDNQPNGASPEQYRGVAGQVLSLLAEAEPGDELHALLAVAPSAAQLYENLRYDRAGLCLAPLDTALKAEMAAAEAIARARRKS